MLGKVISGSFARTRRRERAASILALLSIVLAPLATLNLPIANAGLSVFYDFESAGELASNFNETQAIPGAVFQRSDGGISNSGAIHTPGYAQAIFSSKSSYSLGPVGSTYTFSSFLKSVGPNGYSGMGFTSQSPATATNSPVYRPNDAIGISVHGGGFLFHNGTTNVSGSWSSDNLGTGLVAVKKSSIVDLLGQGSTDDWYKVVFKIEVALNASSEEVLNTRVEVWPSNSSGVLLDPSAAEAIFELNGLKNPTIQAAPSIHSYINFSGDRVYFFDNYSVNLAGGATVVEAGAPVVLTNSVETADSSVVVSGEVVDDGGVELTQQGFVFGTTDEPVVDTDSVVLSDTASIGEFSGEAPALPPGDYFVRAFAENASELVSYGVALPVTIESSEPEPETCTPSAFDLENFSRVGIPADIYTPSLTDGVVELTPNVGARAGAIWGSQRLNLEHDFEIEAEVKIIPNEGVNRADGIAFVLQPSSSSSLTSGGGLGYGGTTPSFAVEFDTYQNADPSNNHIALMKDGNTDIHNAWGPEPYNPAPGTFDLVNGSFTKIKFAWDSTAGTFSFYLDVNQNGTFDEGETIYDAEPLTLGTHFSATDNYVYWGFTGATGGQFNTQAVKLSCTSLTARTNTPPEITAPSTSLEVEETKTVAIALEDDSTTQAQWNVEVVSPSADVSVDLVEVVSATEARVTITGLAEANSDLEVKVVDADGAETLGTLSVTVGNTSPPPPTEPQDPGEPDVPEPDNEPSEKPVKPTRPVVAPPAPTPTPSPVPSGEGGSILMPVLDPTPNVVYGPTNPIPSVITEALRVPLAYVLELLSGLPELPRLAPTESLAYENGSPVRIQLVKTDSKNGYVLIGDGWEVSLEATDSSGEPLLLDENGNIILNADRFVQFSGNGFAPGSIVKVWLFSEPNELSEVLADENGNFIGKALIPESVPTGEHTIQLNGLTQDGQLRSVALGVLIQPEIVISPAVPVGFDLSGLMNILWIIAAGVVLFFFILWRRRKKEEEGSPVTSGNSPDPIFASEGFAASLQLPNDAQNAGSVGPDNGDRFGFKPKDA